MRFPIKFLCLLWCLVSVSNLFAGNAPTLLKFKGKVFIDDQQVAKGAAVPYKSMLKVEGDNSFAVIRYPSGSTVLVKKGIAKILNLDDTESVSMLNGLVFVFVKKSAKANAAGQRFMVHTPKVSMGVRGTKFMAQHNDEGSYLCVCEGSVETKSGTNVFNVGKGQDLWARNGTPDSKITKANKQMMSMAKDGFVQMGEPVR